MSIKVIGIGRIATDVELKKSQTNISIINFNLATDRRYKDSDGNKQTDFIKCVCFRLLADNVSKYCSKGSKIYIEGDLTTRQYDTESGTKYVTEVVCDSVQFLETKKEEQKQDEDSEFNQEQYNQVKRVADKGSSSMMEEQYKTSKQLAAEEDLPF